MADQKSTMNATEEKARNVGQKAKEKAGQLKDTAQARGSEVADVAQEKLSEVTHETENQARRVADAATQEARSVAADRKSQFASELDSVAQAFRASSRELEARDQAMVARYSREVADRVSQASNYMQQRSVDQMMTDVENFARQQPDIFLAGAFGLGLLASRFLKSSEAGSMQRQQQGGSPQWSQRAGGSQAGQRSTRGEYELAQQPTPLPQSDATRNPNFSADEEAEGWR